MAKHHRLLAVVSLSVFLAVLAAAPAYGAASAQAIPMPRQEPIVGNTNCDWELSVYDTQEYLYEENGETLRKLTTVKLLATKKGGTDYYGKYGGRCTIEVFNGLSAGEDALPVLFGGQTAVSKEFAVSFTLEPLGDKLIPTWEFSPLPERDYDGLATLLFDVKLSQVRGILGKLLLLEGLAAKPGMEFAEGEMALLYVDGGYVSLTLQAHWQVPGPFMGALIGIPKGKIPSVKPTTPPSQLITPSPKPTVPPARLITPSPKPTRGPIQLITPSPKPTRGPIQLITPSPEPTMPIIQLITLPRRDLVTLPPVTRPPITLMEPPR